MERRQLDEGAATIWPIGFGDRDRRASRRAIVNPFVIAPLGGAITLIACFGLVTKAPAERLSHDLPAQASTRRRRRTVSAQRLLERHARARRPRRPRRGLPRRRFGLCCVLPRPAAAGDRPRPDPAPSPKAGRGRHLPSDPAGGEVSRRAAYVRNNGLLGNRRASRSCPAAAPTSAARPSPTGRSSRGGNSSERTSTGESARPDLPARRLRLPLHGSEFDTEGNRTAGPAPRALDRYHSRSATAPPAATSTASAAFRAQARTPGSTASNA